ncbi:MAG: 50S ribosomal protein L23 [Deltaproteobacteria bacterium]|nr:MAG: 50S ribosomal protein L23 [Deltaproteobacteria bacterium]
MKPFYEIIKKPLVTEKSVVIRGENNTYSFEVSLDASKPSIKAAVQDYFNVKVKGVRTIVVRGNKRRIGRYSGRRANWKKALVELAPGQKIDIFEVK